MEFSLWNLPGPTKFLQDIAKSVANDQQVFAILPQYLWQSPEYIYEMADKLASHIGEAPQLMLSDYEGVMPQICQQISEDPRRHPESIVELLTWYDTPEAARSFIVNIGDLAERRAEAIEFLVKFNTESRPVKAINKFIFIISSDDAEAIAADTTAINQKWFWNRITRWDIVTLLAQAPIFEGRTNLVAEIELETLVEIAGWNLPVAIEFANGAGREAFQQIIGNSTKVPAIKDGAVGAVPPKAALEGWNAGLVEGWQGRIATAKIDNNRAEWIAQARVLLPYIEIKRDAAERKLREVIGAKFDNEVQKLNRERKEFYATTNYSQEDSPVPEVVTLKILAKWYDRGNENLRKALDALHNTRNLLSHLTPIPEVEIEELIAATKALT